MLSPCSLSVLIFRPSQAHQEVPKKLILHCKGWAQASEALNNAWSVLGFHVCFSVIMLFSLPQGEKHGWRQLPSFIFFSFTERFRIPSFSLCGRIYLVNQRPKVMIWQPKVAIGIMGFLKEGRWKGRWHPRHLFALSSSTSQYGLQGSTLLNLQSIKLFLDFKTVIYCLLF